MRIAVQGRSKHQIMMSNEYRGIFLNKLNYLNYSLSVKGHFALDVLVRSNLSKLSIRARFATIVSDTPTVITLETMHLAGRVKMDRTWINRIVSFSDRNIDTMSLSVQSVEMQGCEGSQL